MNIEFGIPSMEIVSTSPDFRESTVKIAGLNKSMGDTMGNSIRRTLLSAIPGIAPLAYTILGSENEFTDIPGSTSDTTEIALKLKNIKMAINYNYEGDTTTGYIPDRFVLTINKVLNNESVKFKDFIPEDPNLDITILNPEEEITYIGTEKTVIMRLLIWTGLGYATYHENVKEYGNVIKENLGENAIPIDSDFNPIERAVYKVEEDSPSKGVETLVLTVTTNGFIPAITAISQACGIISATAYALQSVTNIFINPFEASVEKGKIDTKFNRPSDLNLATPIEKLGLSVELYNDLKNKGINTMGDLSESTDPNGELKSKIGREVLNINPGILMEEYTEKLYKANITSVEDLIRDNILEEERKEIINRLENLGLKIHEEI